MDGADQLRKAAILVAGLDRRSADAVLDLLDPDQAQRLRDGILALGPTDSREELAAIREFLGRTTPQRMRGDSPASTRPGSDVVSTISPHSRTADDGSDSALGRASERLIAECLCEELPQTIAVALSQLSTRRASEVVAHLPSSVQAQVLERLVDLDPATTLESAAIRAEFHTWLQHQVERSLHRAELAARLATILDVTSPGTRQRILDNVTQSDARLAKELQHRLGEPLGQVCEQQG
jgi:flagellar motor switch protein FliG